MKDIFLHLFYGHLNESERSLKEFNDTDEFKKVLESLKRFEETFNKDQLKLFDEYTAANSFYVNLERERVYINGVKTGMCFILELLNFEPSYE